MLDKRLWEKNKKEKDEDNKNDHNQEEKKEKEKNERQRIDHEKKEKVKEHINRHFVFVRCTKIDLTEKRMGIDQFVWFTTQIWCEKKKTHVGILVY